MGFFEDYFKTTDDRVIMKWAHYYDIYERELARYRDQPISFLEIGAVLRLDHQDRETNPDAPPDALHH